MSMKSQSIHQKDTPHSRSSKLATREIDKGNKCTKIGVKGTFKMNQKIRLLPQWVQTIHLDSLNLHTGSTAVMEKNVNT